jgi:hypothetical protein
LASQPAHAASVVARSSEFERQVHEIIVGRIVNGSTVSSQALRIGPERREGQCQPVSRERSCVHPFIRRVQAVLKRSGSLRASLHEVPAYQIRAREIYRVDVYCIHALAVSTLSLDALVMYEYLRYRGIPFPDSRWLLGSVMPTKNCSDRIVTRKPTEDKRHEAMSKEM